MEFENVSLEVEWEARRIAAAFGVASYKMKPHPTLIVFEGKMRRVRTRVWWMIKEQGWLCITIGASRPKGRDYQLVRSGDPLGTFVQLHPCADQAEKMARGLYRLGFEDERVLAQLPALSAHEKLELRLSLPREFWPKTWLEEEGK